MTVPLRAPSICASRRRGKPSMMSRSRIRSGRRAVTSSPAWDSRLSRPPWSKSSPVPAVSASGSTAAAIAASIFAHLPSESRWRTARFAAWDRKAICSEPLPLHRA